MSFMTKEEIATLKETYDRLKATQGYLAETFYRRLFVIAPQARALFPDDMTPQLSKLTQMLDLLMDNLHQPWFFSGKLKRLARRHVTYGALPEHYPIVGEALVSAIDEMTPGGLSLVERTLWENLFNHLANTMIEAAYDKAS